MGGTGVREGVGLELRTVGVESVDLTVVIPTLNEEGAIRQLVQEIQKAGYPKILVVDGYSTDRTREFAESAGAPVVCQHGQGKAGAVLAARDLVETRYLVLMDGDGTYDPRDISRLAAYAEEYDEIIGARPISSTPNMSFAHKVGNRALTFAFNLLMGSQLPDIASGMYLVRTARIREMIFDRNGFEVDQEVAANMLTVGKVTSVPIGYRKRKGRSKSTTWRQGFRALFAIVGIARRYNVVVFFGLTAALALVPGGALLAYAAALYLAGSFRSGYFLAALMLFVIGGQGLSVATVGYMLRRMERRLRGQL